MNLWQSAMAVGALTILGLIALNTNTVLLSHTDNVRADESRMTALALAQSLGEEAMTKYFDAQPENSDPGVLTKTSDLTKPNDLGPGATERYHGGANDYNDFDDFNGLFVVYKSANPADSASTPGSDYEEVIPGLKSKYFAKATVAYVKVTGSNIPIPDQTSNSATWHKKITVIVTDASMKDSVSYTAIMSYWP